MKKNIISLVIIVLAFPFYLYSGTFYISGKIGNQSKEPLSDVEISIVNSKIKTTTNKNGEFVLKSKDSTVTIIIKKDGFQQVKLNVNPYLNEYYFILLDQLSEYHRNTKETKLLYEDDAPRKEATGADGATTTTEVIHSGTSSAKTETVETPLLPEGAKVIEFDDSRKAITIKDDVKIDELSSASIVADFSSIAPSKHYMKPNARAGLLTAGEVNDFSKWNLWQDISNEDLSAYVNEWKVKPLERYTIQLETNSKSPIVNALVTLKQKDSIIWQSRTDNTGKAELWANAFYAEMNLLPDFNIDIEYRNFKQTIKNAKLFQSGINFINFNVECNFPKNLDIAFVVDATGSMGDEIEYLKAELTDIMQKVKDSIPQLNIRTSSLFYRDIEDEYLTKHKDFTDNIVEMVEFIKTNTAFGGGDYPEAVDEALYVAMNKLSWNDEALAKIIFLVLDAPPHNTPASIAKLENAIRKASAMGIRIVPLVCSGIDKSTEYIMRSIALLTNGTYLFLTDDSGIGERHIDPTTDEFTVKLLNALLFKTIYQMTYVPECEPLIVANTDTLVVLDPTVTSEAKKGLIPSDENIFTEDNPFNNDVTNYGWKYYPNPCKGQLFIETKGEITELFICDVAGKIVFRVINSNERVITIDLSEYPNGMYFIRYEYELDKWLSGKLLLSR